MKIPAEVNRRIEQKLSARQSFFTLVDNIRKVQRKIHEDRQSTPKMRIWLSSHLERLDGILDRAAEVMLSQGIIVASEPFHYAEAPSRFDYDLKKQDWDTVPPLMVFTAHVLFMRRWQLVIRMCEGHRQKCYHNLFEFQEAVDRILAKGWLWDQAQATREYLRIWREHEKSKQQHSQTN